MLHYFNALPKDKDLGFEENLKLSKDIQKRTKNALTPFYQYVDTTIKSLKNKEDIKAKWHKITSEYFIELQLVGYLYKIDAKSKIIIEIHDIDSYRIKNIDEIELDFEEKLIFKIDGKKSKFSVFEKDIEDDIVILPSEIRGFAKNPSWAGEIVELEPLWINPKEGDRFEQNGKMLRIIDVDSDEITVAGEVNEKLDLYYNNKIVSFILDKDNQLKIPSEAKAIANNVFYSQKIQNGFKEEKNISQHVDIENLKFEDGTTFDFKRNENLLFKIPVEDEQKYKDLTRKKVVSPEGVKFSIAKPKKSSKDNWWIQIEEIGDIDDDSSFDSPLKHFFDDDIQIKDSKGNKYDVDTGRANEFQLILRKNRDYIFPAKGALTVSVNIYQLRMQKRAIQTLQNNPVNEHSKLIKLFENRERVQWSLFNSVDIKDWFVLTQESRSGSDEQRQFVQDALATPDFAILEGPPGSGKTTVILELICQIIKKGGRVLLCGSTHVAIDNVLERLNEENQNGVKLIEQFDILPIRIGDSKRIGDDVEKFQINNVIANNSAGEELLLDSANLVCGTTIGILQHPKFKYWGNRKDKPSFAKEDNEPIVPEFDYLIIDESSKTTFQEFLVPALYAKKWILAGDIMQLSPFTDREEVVSNLNQLELNGGEKLPESLQKACFVLQKLEDILSKDNKFIIEIAYNNFHYFQEELEARKKSGDLKHKEILFVDSLTTLNYLGLCRFDVVFLSSNIIKSLNWSKVPEIFIKLYDKNWLTSEYAYKLNHLKDKLNFEYREGKKEITSNLFEISEKINKYFIEKDWAEEIAWRISREYELRNILERKREYLGKGIEKLLPRTDNDSIRKEDVKNRVNTIASVAFPSILESFVVGIKGRRRVQKSTISEGFSKEELENRRTVLKYQHRMHPEISEFPREQFYKNNVALLDLEQPKRIEELREWDYNEYDKRRVWIDVKARNVSKNRNYEEATQIIKELKKFVVFAKRHEQPEGKEWSVACLTFYRGQEKVIREKLQDFCKLPKSFSSFYIKNGNSQINIKLHTVDKFQGHEADIVFLSMVRNKKDGFMDNPNRLNVAITRAKFQLAIVGDYNYFSKSSKSDDLNALANKTIVAKE